MKEKIDILREFKARYAPPCIQGMDFPKLAIRGIQPYGKYIAVALEGSEQAIRDTHTAMFNVGMCGELQETCPKYLFAWVKPEKLVRGLTAIWENRLWLRFGRTAAKKVKGGLYAVAKRMAERQIANMEHLTFLRKGDICPDTASELEKMMMEACRQSRD